MRQPLPLTISPALTPYGRSAVSRATDGIACPPAIVAAAVLEADVICDGVACPPAIVAAVGCRGDVVALL